MAIKNRPTLIQQFSDFINRVAPYDNDPLIQKTELNQVEDDFFDSALLKAEVSQAINGPSSLINLDFDSVDQFQIDSNASIDTTFTMTVQNLSEGQIGKVSILKKNNDSYSFSNAFGSGLNNLSQFGSAFEYFIVNISGRLIAISDLTINKSDSISTNSTDLIATSKAVNDLRGLVNSNNSSTQSQISSINSDINSLESNKVQKGSFSSFNSGMLNVGASWSFNSFSGVRNDNGLVTGHIGFAPLSSAITNKVMGTLNIGWRPRYTHRLVGVRNDTSTNGTSSSININISTSGQIQINFARSFSNPPITTHYIPLSYFAQ